jgi:hypothetical protein
MRHEQPPMARVRQPERSWAQLGAREAVSRGWIFDDLVRDSSSGMCTPDDPQQQGATSSAACGRPCDRRRLTVLGARIQSRSKRAASPASPAAPEGSTGRSGEGRSAGCTRRLPSPSHRAPTRARRRWRVGGRLGSWPHRGVALATPGPERRAARISGPIDAGEPCVGVVVEDEDRVARRWRGRTLQRRTAGGSRVFHKVPAEP